MPMLQYTAGGASRLTQTGRQLRPEAGRHRLVCGSLDIERRSRWPDLAGLWESGWDMSKGLLHS